MTNGTSRGRYANATFLSHHATEFVHPKRDPSLFMSGSGPSNHADPREQMITKKRRGRQPRPSLVSPSLQVAISKFTSRVGGPIIQPGGFRDYTGWLETISNPSFQSDWTKLSLSFLQECTTADERTIPQLKKDIVTEIINMVVKKQPHESSKLVSTNARRQCVSSPSGGTTVMTLFESYLASLAAAQTADKQSKRAGGSASASRSGDRQGQHASGSRSGGNRQRSGSGMEISSLLTDNTRHVGPSSSHSKLPPLSDFDEQIRVRKEREGDRSR